MAIAPWRLNLQPASFRGAVFHVDVDGKRGGRRNVTHEFPKKDTPYTEDMGRKARHFTITAYLVSGPLTLDYRADRDALEAALEQEGPGLLVHPTRPADQVCVDDYSSTEHREKGGWVEFDITFVEAGQAISTTIGTDTQGASNSTAQSAIGSFQQSTDISSLAAG